VAALGALLRIFSYLYHALLALFLLGIALVAWSSGQDLHLEMLPWHGPALTYWLLGGALIGLLTEFLALRRTWRGLFFLWSLFVLGMMLRGFFFSSYHFSGDADFHRALWLTGGALVALFGAWSRLRAIAAAYNKG
jgi:hypothetical protein